MLSQGSISSIMNRFMLETRWPFCHLNVGQQGVETDGRSSHPQQNLKWTERSFSENKGFSGSYCTADSSKNHKGKTANAVKLEGSQTHTTLWECREER
ncbi:hypothetical protein GN956_G24167 [Arapaima gigas]